MPAAAARVLALEQFSCENRLRLEPRCVMHYIAEGSMVYVDHSGRHALSPGWAAIFCYNEPSAFGPPRDASEGGTTSYCSFVGAGLREHWAQMRQRFGSVFYLGAAHPLRWALVHLGRYARLAHGPEHEQKRPLDVFEVARAVHGFVTRLHAYLEGNGNETQSPVERAIDEILRHPTYPWSIKELANE